MQVCSITRWMTAGASFRHPRCCGCLIRSWGELIHWLHYHLKGSNPPPALYHLEMLLQSLEYLRGGRHYLYNSIYEITRLEAYP